MEGIPKSLLVGTATILGLALLAGAGYLATVRPVPVAVSQAHRCDSKPARLAGLFSDDDTTLIRLSNPDLTDLHVLRAEPAAQLPGMFDSLLALSLDATRLAYVTAANEVMDDAHLWAIDVTHPSQRQELAHVQSGLWPERPAWSPDNQKVAFVTVEETDTSTGARRFLLWTTDLGRPLPNASQAEELNPADFMNGHGSSICWSAGGRPTLVDAAGSPFTRPSSSASPGSPASPESPSATPAATAPLGSACGVPVFSQNDPSWRHLVMAAAGDLIGRFGCALTSTAMMLDYYGANLTPTQLNACLGAYADPLFWSKASSCTNGVVSGGDLVPFSWPELDSVLARGDPAVVGLIRGQTGSHFVVVTSGSGQVSSGYTIADPWDGSTGKTLGSYVYTGYNLGWIVTYHGPERHCSRSTGPGSGLDLPHLVGINDGGVYRNPVPVGDGSGASGNSSTSGGSGGSGGSAGSGGSKPGPGSKHGSSHISLIDLTPSLLAQMLQPAPTPRPTYMPTYMAVRTTPLPSGLTVADQGIYMLSIVTPQAAGPPRIDFMKFTIDTTPPQVSPGLATATQGSASPSWGRLLAAEHPRLNKVANLQISTRDNLSGVLLVEYRLDGGAWQEYSNNTSLRPTISVTKLGDHTLFSRATDLAGNVAPEVSFDFTVYDDTPPAAVHVDNPPAAVHATPTPTHTPTASPTATPVSFTLTPNPLAISPNTNLTGTAQVQNGPVPATITDIHLSKPDWLRVTGGTCRVGLALNPNQGCTIVVTYDPRFATSSDLVVTASGVSRTIAVTGTIR